MLHIVFQICAENFLEIRPVLRIFATNDIKIKRIEPRKRLAGCYES